MTADHAGAPAPELADQVAIVTGAAGGIGAATTAALLDLGARVALLDSDRTRIEAAGEELGEAAEVLPLVADVAELAQVEEAVDRVLASWGTIHILVNNAGIARDRVAWHLRPADWQAVLATNLTGTWNCCRAVIPTLRASGRGRIVNVSSINGLRGRPGLTNYAASKAGVIGMTRVLARELGPRGITVNAVAPGYIRTDLTAGLPAETQQRARNESALGRLGLPGEVADCIAFLCSPRAGYITGAVIPVDGGQLA